MGHRFAVCGLVLGLLCALSSGAFAGFSVTLDTGLENGDEHILNGVYDYSDSGPLISVPVAGPGSIGPETSSGGSSASTGLFNLAYDSTSISGSASSTATVVPAGASADGEGNINLYFTVDQETPFTLTSTLGAGGGRLALSFIAIEDTNIISAGYGLVVQNQLNTGSNTFQNSGTFMPGDQYYLTVGAESDAANDFTTDYNAYASFNFDLELPEPSAGSVACLSALMLLARRRRRAAGAQPACTASKIGCRA